MCRDEFIEDIEKSMISNAECAEHLYEVAIQEKLTNEQFFLNWQDRLNKVSLLPEEDEK